MSENSKSGKSLILLVIVICVMSIALFFVSRIFNNSIDDTKAEEEAFKLSVYGYCNELQSYKQVLQNNGQDSSELNVYGSDLKNVIPDIIETDMPKFKIEKGNLIYIGMDQNEKEWTSEVEK